MITFKDEFSNVLLFDGLNIRLRLASGQTRNLGKVHNDTWYVERSPEGVARGQGHVLFKLNCWGINRESCIRHRQIGFEWVHFEGYDKDGKFWRIERRVDVILSRGETFHFDGAGFEAQISFPVDYGPVGVLG